VAQRDRVRASVATLEQQAHSNSALNRCLTAARLGPIVVAVLVAGCATDADPAAVSTAEQTTNSATAQSASPSQSKSGTTHALADTSDGAIGVSVTVPSGGWSGEPGGWALEYLPDGFDPPAGAGIIAFVVDEEFYVYGDPCDWKRTRPETPATTVGGIVRALANQASRDPLEPEEITAGGYPGKKITLHVPDDARFRECDESTFATFGVAGEDPALYAQGPGEIDEIWIVDVDGRVVLLEGGYFADTRPGVVDELHEILSSATFD
jgi:hypothetical protein